MTSKLKPCPSCEKEVAKSAKVCPHCGKKLSMGCLLKTILLLVAIIVVGFIMIITLVPSKEDREDKLAHTLATIASAPVSNISPSGELAEIFNPNSEHTDLQRDDKEKELQGQVVQWSLPVYEVSRIRDGYRIQTEADFALLGGAPLVGTVLTVHARSDAEVAFIEGLKTGDEITIKGRIKGISLRRIEIDPAMIDPAIALTANPSAATTQAPSALRQLFMPESLGVQAGYLEQKHRLEPKAVANKGNTMAKLYEVDGCEIELEYDQIGNSEALTVYAGKNCVVDVLVPTGEGREYKRSDEITLDEVVAVDVEKDRPAHYQATCVNSCGGSQETVYSYVSEGARVNNYVSYKFSFKTVNGGYEWATRIAEDQGVEPWDVISAANCPEYDRWAMEMWSGGHLSSVTLFSTNSGLDCAIETF